VPAGHTKFVLQHPDPSFSWEALFARHAVTDYFVLSSHCVAAVKNGEDLREALPAEGVTLMSAGETIEIYKETGSPDSVMARFDLAGAAGSHAIGHTRMATESAVTTAGSHPFSTGMDLCLVHNGSLSNHNRLRRNLRREGIIFRTDNDSEVAAGYLSWRLQLGDSLEDALHGALSDLDGFFTFAVGTADGFAVLRDPIACKPAILAETEDYVAMASEYRSLTHLPGIETASLWEPDPGKVYVWKKAAAAELLAA
jgi:amidophosphoribosyltransferase